MLHNTVKIALAECPYKMCYKRSILPSIVSILLGRSSLTLKEITVYVRIIGFDYIGEIIIVILVPNIWTFEKRAHC